MLKLFIFSKKKSLNNLNIILNRRKLTQTSKTSIVRKIILNVKKKGDKEVIKYERKFSKIKIKSVKIIFSKKEISKISNKVDKRIKPVSYTHLRAHETLMNLVCRLLLEKRSCGGCGRLPMCV